MMSLTDILWIFAFVLGTSICNYVGYAKQIGLLQVIAFVAALMSAVPMMTETPEGFPLAFLFLAANLVLMVVGLWRD